MQHKKRSVLRIARTCLGLQNYSAEYQGATKSWVRGEGTEQLLLRLLPRNQKERGGGGQPAAGTLWDKKSRLENELIFEVVTVTAGLQSLRREQDPEHEHTCLGYSARQKS